MGRVLEAVQDLSPVGEIRVFGDQVGISSGLRDLFIPDGDLKVWEEFQKWLKV